MRITDASPTGVFSTGMLVHLGVTRTQLGNLVRAHQLRVIRRGWYATQGAHPWVVEAVRAGGRLSGLHALKSRETALDAIWLPPGAEVHLFAPKLRGQAPRWLPLAQPASAAGGLWAPLSSADSFSGRLVETRAQWHVRPTIASLHTGFGVMPVVPALRHGLTGVSLAHAVAVVDSLLRLAQTRRRSSTGNAARQRLRISAAEVVTELRRTAFGRQILSLVDLRAESGLESIVRVLLTLAGHRVESQVELPDGTWIDLLVDGVLAIELDGSTHLEREQRDRDRRKDQMITRVGHVPARYSYRQIIEQWDATYHDILLRLSVAR